MRRAARPLVAGVLSACLAALPMLLDARIADRLPTRLTDREFWRLSAELSEPDGAFRSDNLVSNEQWLQHVIPDLTKTVVPGGVYLGVGPEQNFTYIAAVKPAMAFIIDIRRGNLALHLMYKALFEVSANRTEFVSRLFSRKPSKATTEPATAVDLFDTFARADASQALHDETLALIHGQLVTTHGFALSDRDWSELKYAFDAFTTFGSRIHYLSTGTDAYGGSPLPTYADLMTATDRDGGAHSYLSTEDSFRFVKDLESRNLIVPVVGDFAGPKALTAIGGWVKSKGATVSAFYLSNVELYLYRELSWTLFCRNAATLPLDDTSVLIRSAFDGRYGRGFGLNQDFARVRQELEPCAPSHR